MYFEPLISVKCCPKLTERGVQEKGFWILDSAVLFVLETLQNNYISDLLFKDEDMFL